jgi:sec-independent protein translocase protein TatA
MLTGLENPFHLLLVLVVVLLVFGPRRFPDIGRSLGSSIREFKESLNSQSDPENISHDSAAGTPVRRQPTDGAE